MKIEEYIKLRKKKDGLDENDCKRKDENIRKLVNYIFDYYNLLDGDYSTGETETRELRRNVTYQYEIEVYSEDTQKWLMRTFTQYNTKLDRKIKEILDDTDYFLLISDASDWKKLSYHLFSKITEKYKYLSEYPLEILMFAKDYYMLCNKQYGIAVSRYNLSPKSKKTIKNIYLEYGINLVAWANCYLRYFYSRITLWPSSHRIEVEEDGKIKYQYDINATRNTFRVGSVLEKLSEVDGSGSALRKNRKVLVDLLREISIDRKREMQK